MPRKTCEFGHDLSGRIGFNEAAARCRGKPDAETLLALASRTLQ